MNTAAAAAVILYGSVIGDTPQAVETRAEVLLAGLGELKSCGPGMGAGATAAYRALPADGEPDPVSRARLDRANATQPRWGAAEPGQGSLP